MSRILSTQVGIPCVEFVELDDAVDWCERWVKLHARAGGRPSAYFDIDDTLLRRDNTKIDPTCRLFDACVRARVAPFLITARPSEGYQVTEEQLRSHGLDGYKRLMMHPPHSRCRTASEAGRAKLAARHRIEGHGYTACLNAGDAPHDHAHPHASRLFGAIDRDAIYVFVTSDGVAHLKLPG